MRGEERSMKELREDASELLLFFAWRRGDLPVRRVAAGAVLLVMVSACMPVSAANIPGKKKAEGAKQTPPEEALKAYIQRVRAEHDTEVRTPGSIWVDQGRLVRLSTDAKAARLHDVVSIVVAESVAAETDGQVKNSRASN